jgi:hypothetical protein
MERLYASLTAISHCYSEGPLLSYQKSNSVHCDKVLSTAAELEVVAIEKNLSVQV